MKDEASYIVLLFHSVDGRGRLSLKNLGNIRPDVFERTCGSLKREFDVISLRELVALISEGGKKAGRFLSVTFDDGPKSYASIAAPLMSSLGIPSACFLITDYIGDKAIYWRYLYNYCINAGYGEKLARLISAESGVPLKKEEVIGFTRGSYETKKNKRILEGIAGSIVTPEEYRDAETDLFLSFDDIEWLKKDPLVTFGIHTRSHPAMMELSGVEISDELSGSIASYRDMIEDDVPMFSVPFGRLGRDYDERTVLASLELGIPAVFSAYGGLNEKGRPLYNIRRMPVTEKLLERGVDAFVRSLAYASVAPEYIEREKSLSDAVEEWLRRRL
jgi:peptidoglycan/xylan/chitin deacetylase (PgdA/CDA1 family)